MELTLPTVGRIVHFFPGTHEANKLPNGMTHAAAIVLQTFDEGLRGLVNLQLFLAETDVNKNPQPIKWSVAHKSTVISDEMPYWDWPSRD